MRLESLTSNSLIEALLGWSESLQDISLLKKEGLKRCRCAITIKVCLLQTTNRDWQIPAADLSTNHRRDIPVPNGGQCLHVDIPIRFHVIAHNQESEPTPLCGLGVR